MGGWKEKDVTLHVTLEEDVWYVALVNWLTWDKGTWICHWLHYIPLPWFIRNIEGHWDKDDPEYFAKFEDWFGDDFGCLYHCHVCDPLCQWGWRLRKPEQDIHIELTLDEARKKFGAEHEAIKWVEKELAERKQHDAEKLVEIRGKYASGELTREQALEKLEWHFEGENLEELLDKKPE
jgi:hypothetical protein